MTTEDLMGRIHAAVHSADPNVRAEAVARLIDDVTAELRGDVELLTGRVEAAEDNENLIRDTLAKRSAVVNTLGAENERLRSAWNLAEDRRLAAVAEVDKIRRKHLLCRECNGSHESCQAARVKCCPDCYHLAPLDDGATDGA